MSSPSARTPFTGERRRRWLAIFGFVLAALLLPFARRVENTLETGVRIPGGEADAVDAELAQQFQSPYVHRVVLVATGMPHPNSSAGTAALQTIATGLRKEAGVSAVISRLDLRDPLFLGEDGGTLLVVGLSPRSGSVEGLIPSIRSRAHALQDQLRAQYPKLTLELTGETPLNFDIRKVSADDVSAAEVRVLPITLVLLLIAFGSVVAALLPVGVGLLSISMTLGASALLARHLHLSILIQNIATMLGLGLGIDYALLMISRFREALALGCEPGAAADIAVGNAGKTLLISAATVAIGFAALLTVPISELRSIGVAGLSVAATSVMLCTCILPWVLGLLGHRINRWRLRLPRSLRGRQQVRVRNEASTRWHGWGDLVTGRPWTALLVTGVPLLLLSYQATRMTIGLPPGDWLPSETESVQALHSLERMDRSGIVFALRIVLELPASAKPSSQAGWTAASRMARYLASDARTAEVISLPSLTSMAPNATVLEQVPAAMRKSFLRRDGLATLLEALPHAAVTPSQQIAWLQELRGADIATITGVPGARIRIGGVPALNADYVNVVEGSLPRVMTLVIGGSLAALLVGLGSLFAAAKAIALNLLSVSATFGALVLVFQDGHGSFLLHQGSPTGAVFPIVPILVFAIVFGLSMDYEVFLVARVLEERRRGLPERAAVVEALASTAGLITSAAAIMIAVFAAFTLGRFLVIQMLGFALAVAVLIDATVVRMVIGPALLQLAGDWNWWPYGLRGHDAAKQGAAQVLETRL